MALTNYASLKAAVASFLNKTNLTEQIPDFIAIAEAQMRRSITSIGQIDTWSDVEVDGDGYVLPCGFEGVASVSYAGVALPFLSADRPAETCAGTPRSYTIDGDTLRVSPTGTVTIRIKGGFCPLSTTVPVNWILRDHPDAYLYGALMQAAPYLRDDDRVGVWGSLFTSAIDGINKREVRRQTGGNVRIQAGPTP